MTRRHMACSYCYATSDQPCTDRRRYPPIRYPFYMPDRPVVNDHWWAKNPPTDQEGTT